MEFVVSVIKLFWVGVSDTTATYLKHCAHTHYVVDNIQMYIMSQLHTGQIKHFAIVSSQTSFVSHFASKICFIRRSLQHIQFKQCSRISIFRMEQLSLASYTKQSMYIIITRRGRKSTLRDNQRYICALICTQTALKLHLPQLQNVCIAHTHTYHALRLTSTAQPELDPPACLLVS